MALAIQPGRVVSVRLSHPLPKLVEVHLPDTSSNGIHLGSRRRMVRGRAVGRYARWTPAEDRVLRQFPVERFIDPVERRKLYNAKIFLGHGRTPNQIRYRYMRLHRGELEQVFATVPTDGGGPSAAEGAALSGSSDGHSAPTSMLPLSQAAPRHHGEGIPDLDGHPHQRPHPRPLHEPIYELVDDLTDEILLQIAYALKEARDQVHEAIRRGQAKADEALRRTFQRLMQAVREIQTSVDTR